MVVSCARSHRLEMREIKPQPVRRHQRAFLLDMRAQHLAQRGMQQMRRGVIQNGCGTS